MDSDNNSQSEDKSKEDYFARAYMLEQQTVEIKPIKTDGFILDIGGGGEGIIGKLNGEQVVAIDKRIKELEETNNPSLKIVMDATELQFLDNTFNVATAFYSMMYIHNEEKPQVFAEVFRVLCKGGTLYIWDTYIPEKADDKKFFVIPLKVILPDEIVETGYGVNLRKQDIQTIKSMAVEAGFRVKQEKKNEHTFYLELKK